MDAANLLATMTWQLGVVCVLTFALGSLGGLLHGVGTSGTAAAAAPGPGPTTPPAPSALRRALVGGVAAVAVLYITDPHSGVALIGGSVVAGYAGHAILAGLEARAVAALAQADAAQKGQDLRDALAAHETLVTQRDLQATPEQQEKAKIAQSMIDSLISKYLVRQ